MGARTCAPCLRFICLASYHAKEREEGGERERFPSKHTVLKVDLLYVRSENILISGVCVCVSTFSSAKTECFKLWQ